MFRQLVAALNGPVAIARRVIGLHRTFVVVAILRYGSYALYGVLRLIQLGKYLAQVFRNGLVTYHHALLRPSLKVYVLHLQRVQYHSSRLSQRRCKR